MTLSHNSDFLTELQNFNSELQDISSEFWDLNSELLNIKSEFREDKEIKKCTQNGKIWTKAVQLIERDDYVHLDSKAGSVIGTKSPSPSPAFRWSGS